MSAPMNRKPERAVQAKIRGIQKENIFPEDWKRERAVQAKVGDLKKKKKQWLWEHGFSEGTRFQFRNGDFRQPSTYGLHSASGLILVLDAISGSFGWTSPHQYFIGLSFNFDQCFGSEGRHLDQLFWRTSRNGISLEACWVFMIPHRATFFFDLSDLVPTFYCFFYHTNLIYSCIHSFMHL